MATITKKIALEIAANNGYYHTDTRAFMILEYENTFHPGNTSYAVIYEPGQFIGYAENHPTTVIWSRDK